MYHNKLRSLAGTIRRQRLSNGKPGEWRQQLARRLIEDIYTAGQSGEGTNQHDAGTAVRLWTGCKCYP